MDNAQNAAKDWTVVENPVPYEVIFEMEILDEVATSVHADYLYYMATHKIKDDGKNPISILADDVFRTKRKILASDTLIELKKIEGGINEARRVLKRLEKIENRKVV